MEQTDLSPPVHQELLTIYAHMALDDTFELSAVLHEPAEKFEALAITRMERSLMAFLDRIVEPSGESSIADARADDYVLTWTAIHERRFRFEGEASEAARSLPGRVILQRPNRTWKAFEKGEEEELEI